MATHGAGPFLICATRDPSGADPGVETPFFVSGFAFSQEGANGHLLFSGI
jgi:hypothetical protein